MSSFSSPTATNKTSAWLKPLLFVLVAAVGLYYVKWSPYYAKSFVAADKHSIGASILANAPAAPWSAALEYAEVYFLAIWKLPVGMATLLNYSAPVFTAVLAAMFLSEPLTASSPSQAICRVLPRLSAASVSSDRRITASPSSPVRWTRLA